MLRLVLIVSGYTALVSILFYLAVYSRLYYWWRSRLGIVMNASLVFTALVASGVAIRFADDDIGRVLSIIGWAGFSISVILRLRLLIATARKQDLEERKDDNDYH